MQQLYYTGVGSRSAPMHVLVAIQMISCDLKELGFTLRSGAAKGSDTAFESGAGKRTEIFLPWKHFNGHPSHLYEPSPEAFEIAATLHPVWNKLSKPVKRLHARNVHQILGHNLETPSDMLVCWTPNGATVGGTATTIILARRLNIPEFNLARIPRKDIFKFAKVIKAAEEKNHAY